jgi:hypothetical protein
MLLCQGKRIDSSVHSLWLRKFLSSTIFSCSGSGAKRINVILDNIAGCRSGTVVRPVPIVTSAILGLRVTILPTLHYKSSNIVYRANGANNVQVDARLFSSIKTKSISRLSVQSKQIVAEWLGCPTLNQRVVGSNPGEGTAWYLWAGYLKIHSSG